jgi:transposase
VAFALVPDELWEQIEPILPTPPPRPEGGRPPVSNRKALVGIVFVLRTGTPWNLLPKEMGCGSGVTCWRRLRDWTKLGIWPAVHQRLLNVLGRAGRVDLSRAVIDSQSVRAVFGGTTRVRTQQTERKRAVSGIS